MASPTAVALDLALIAASVAGLWFGAERLVGAAVRIATGFGVSELVVGLTVVAFGTSSPELAVTVGAALAGNPDIAVGNVVGSNVFNLGIVLGGVALLGPVAASRDLVRRDGLVLVGTVLLVSALLWNRRLGRVEGLLLVAVLAVYLGVLYRAGEPVERDVRDRREVAAVDALWLLVGIALVVGSANVLVGSASDLARLVGLSEWAIGMTVVAAGTSTPELATSLVAARKGQAGLAGGNLVGSDLFNMLGVLGVAAAIEPMTVAATVRTSMAWVFALVVLAVALLWTRYELSRREGAVLVAFGLVRWAVDLAG